MWSASRSFWPPPATVTSTRRRQPNQHPRRRILIPAHCSSHPILLCLTVLCFSSLPYPTIHPAISSTPTHAQPAAYRGPSPQRLIAYHSTEMLVPTPGLALNIQAAARHRHQLPHHAKAQPPPARRGDSSRLHQPAALLPVHPAAHGPAPSSPPAAGPHRIDLPSTLNRDRSPLATASPPRHSSPGWSESVPPPPPAHVTGSYAPTPYETSTVRPATRLNSPRHRSTTSGSTVLSLSPISLLGPRMIHQPMDHRPAAIAQHPQLRPQTRDAPHEALPASPAAPNRDSAPPADCPHRAPAPHPRRFRHRAASRIARPRTGIAANPAAISHPQTVLN